MSLRCIESKALEKSMNNRDSSIFVDLTPSRIRRTVRIYPGVDLFVRNQFWFSLINDRHADGFCLVASD